MATSEDGPSYFITAAVGLLGILLTYWLLRRSPLDAAPAAHWSVKYSSAWLRWHRYFDSDTLAVHEAHCRYGPVVRLAPKELSVCDVDTGLKPIYEGRLPKTDWYDIAMSYSTEPSFVIKDEESHRRRKRLIAKPYTNSNIRSNSAWQLQQIRLSDNLRTTLQTISQELDAVDVFDVTFAWSLTGISTFLFGPAGAIDLLDDLEKAHEYQVSYTEKRLAGLWLTTWPAVAQRMLRWVGYFAEITCIAQMRERADEGRSIVDNSDWQTKPTAYEYMKSEMLGSTDPSGPARAKTAAANSNALLSEVQDHVVAGLDTSQITLSICTWLLSLEKNRTWQHRLRAETSGLQNELRASDVEVLPILDAVLKETLRLYPVVAGCQPRVTDRAITVGPSSRKVSVPPGVIVHCQAWSLHRSPEVFADPDTWQPDRWLNCPHEQKREMEAWFWAFGSGSRKCLGESLAISSLKVALATIYSTFETKVPEHTKFDLHIGNMLLATSDEEGRVLPILIRNAHHE